MISAVRGGKHDQWLTGQRGTTTGNDGSHLKKKKKSIYSIWTVYALQPNTSAPKGGRGTVGTTWQSGNSSHLQSSKVVPGEASARRFRSSSRSLVTWRSWKRMVSRLSPDGRLSLMAGGGEDASPLTGEPAAWSTSSEAEAIYPKGKRLSWSRVSCWTRERTLIETALMTHILLCE